MHNNLFLFIIINHFNIQEIKLIVIKFLSCLKTSLFMSELWGNKSILTKTLNLVHSKEFI